MQIVISISGLVSCVYAEDIDLQSLGNVHIRRGSHVEPCWPSVWYADLCPMNGPRLGPFDFRSDALNAELAWLESHYRNWAGET